MFLSQKHLGHIGSELTPTIHIKQAMAKKNKTIGLMRNFQRAVPRPSFVTIYKVFIRPRLD